MTKQYIAIPHQLPPTLWYAVPGAEAIEEDGDSYIAGDHDLHNILPVNTPEEVRYAETYNGHQSVAVQRIARTL
jgi:hypothetical protein